ncbi:MAG: RloB family protein [Candidatus Paceibacterota bacterium]
MDKSSSNRRRFSRPLGKRGYRKLVIISSEGAITEPGYFGIFNTTRSVIKVKCVKKKNASSPREVLARLDKYLRQNGLRNTDEAWLVVDKDKWNDGQLNLLYDWSQLKENYGLAVSNPKFEYWLLLHFEDGSGVSSARECSTRLRRYLHDYDKVLDPRRFTREMIQDAIMRARSRDIPPCDDWPRNTGTTVYRLTEKLMG